MDKMTSKVYRAHLEGAIKALDTVLDEPLSAGNYLAAFCERNRLIDKLYEYDKAHTPTAFKIGDKYFDGRLSADSDD